MTLTVTGQRTAGVDVVSAQPDGTELSLDTPDNRINAQLSVTKHDMSFWDLTDPALTVKYTSSEPSVATVDATGAVAPVSMGAALITATATADGETKSTTFPVVVTSGRPDATGTKFPNTHTSRIDFGDINVPLAKANTGFQLSASVVPAAPGTTYSYQIAPMDTNTAGATVTPAGVLTVNRVGHVRVTVTATVSGVKTSESALIVIPPVQQSTTVGGNVPATLALTLGAPATFGPFTPGTAKDYLATTTANVISTAGDGMLSIADPSSIATGHLTNGSFSLPQVLQVNASSPLGTGSAFAPVGGTSNPTTVLTYSGPVSNDTVAVGFKQPIGANDALRTGTYAKTLTFTLSTTQP